MSEIKSLIDKANRYIKSAKLLLDDGDYESAVSRIYYAMFFCAEAVLLTKNLSFSSHKGVISAFGEHFIKTGIFDKKLGRELNRAFEKRQLGDYGSTSVIEHDEAELMLQSGTDFVNSIADWLKKQNL
ncbi:MAG: HEPN domain-containing protein [Planctomycetes bacterium]|nr:HEPN domain-containing protein [Planctomycetota bacterium]MBU1517570.1 HEPN domain-containing protein [Planctomycetota bacterium]MBU2457640.1 HEPN domain-containing protein [Planctomycetota bacterium]